MTGGSSPACGGKELAQFRRERLGFIFQDCNLLDTLTAFENIALALSIVKAPAGEIPGRVRETAALLGISDCLDKYPYQMSGGQQQRCAAARAIVTRPALVLADEPTGALDSKSSRLLLDRLEELNQELGATILMVTHDAFTASCCRRVVFLRDGQIFLELRRGEGEDRRAFFQKNHPGGDPDWEERWKMFFKLALRNVAPLLPGLRGVSAHPHLRGVPVLYLQLHGRPGGHGLPGPERQPHGRGHQDRSSTSSPSLWRWCWPA